MILWGDDHESFAVSFAIEAQRMMFVRHLHREGQEMLKARVRGAHEHVEVLGLSLLN